MASSILFAWYWLKRDPTNGNPDRFLLFQPTLTTPVQLGCDADTLGAGHRAAAIANLIQLAAAVLIEVLQRVILLMLGPSIRGFDEFGGVRVAVVILLLEQPLS